MDMDKDFLMFLSYEKKNRYFFKVEKYNKSKRKLLKYRKPINPVNFQKFRNIDIVKYSKVVFFLSKTPLG